MLTRRREHAARRPVDPAPYAGLDARGNLARASHHVLVSGPTGSGKTRRVLAPAVASWRGPVVDVSSKPDLMSLAAPLRPGPAWLLDLTGQTSPDAGAERVAADPVRAIQTDDDALDLAELLLATGGLGHGSGQSAGQDGGFWRSMAASPLAGVLLAGRDVGMGWVRAAVSVASGEEDEPSWSSAALRCGDSPHGRELAAIMELDPRLRDSVKATMQVAVSPWAREAVRGDGLIPLSLDDFATAAQAGQEPTLHLLAPASGVAAGAAVSVVDQIIQLWRRSTSELPGCLIVVDELANTCPLPSLPTYLTEARGLNIALVGAVQDTSQLALRWGETGRDVLRAVAPSVLLLRGATGEEALLKRFAAAEGQVEAWSRTTSSGREEPAGWQAQSALGDRVHWSDLVPRDVGEGRLLVEGRTGVRVRLPDISEVSK